MSRPEAVCIIPARGGSRGIPRKNLMPVGGRALVAHAIEQARRAGSVGRVVVSTDDVEIAEVATRSGAEVVERLADLAGDLASSESALLHVLETLEARESYRPELVVFLQCTAPLTTAADIDGVVGELLGRGADSALAVAESHGFHWKRDEEGYAVAVNHDARVRPRRQDREPEFVEAGSVYVMRAAGFREARHRFFGKTVLYVQPAERLLEVDHPVDLVHAEVLLRERDRLGRVRLLPDRPAALVLDFDGVLTDNAVLVDDAGREMVRCDRGDGMGIGRMRDAGVPVLVLSTERNPVVTARCEKLRVPCVQALDDKRSGLEAWLAERGIDPRHVVYLGNDVNDADCLRAVGCGVVVRDAHPSVKSLARIVLDNRGGHGAVRELTDLIESRMDSPT